MSEIQEIEENIHVTYPFPFLVVPSLLIKKVLNVFGNSFLIKSSSRNSTFLCYFLRKLGELYLLLRRVEFWICVVPVSRSEHSNLLASKIKYTWHYSQMTLSNAKPLSLREKVLYCHIPCLKYNLFP